MMYMLIISMDKNEDTGSAKSTVCFCNRACAVRTVPLATPDPPELLVPPDSLVSLVLLVLR